MAIGLPSGQVLWFWQARLAFLSAKNRRMPRTEIQIEFTLYHRYVAIDGQTLWKAVVHQPLVTHIDVMSYRSTFTFINHRPGPAGGPCLLSWASPPLFSQPPPPQFEKETEWPADH